MAAAIHAFHDFSSHLRPRQVTVAVRHRMTRELWCEQAMWSALVLSTALAFAFTLIFVFRRADLSRETVYEGLRPVALALIFFLLFLHVRFRRERNFVADAPVTTAIVVREKLPLHFDGESSMAVPRLLLRYLSRPAVEDCDDDAFHQRDAHTLWAELDGFSASFERTVHPGDLVSILYDPTDPQHVRVVELERA